MVFSLSFLSSLLCQFIVQAYIFCIVTDHFWEPATWWVMYLKLWLMYLKHEEKMHDCMFFLQVYKLKKS